MIKTKSQQFVSNKRLEEIERNTSDPFDMDGAMMVSREEINLITTELLNYRRYVAGENI